MSTTAPKPSDIFPKRIEVPAHKPDQEPLKADIQVTPARPKKPYVRPEHLIDRPLKNNAALIELKKGLTPSDKKKGHNR